MEKRLEKKECEGSFRSLFENAPIGIYRADPDGRLRMANPALVRMLACRAGDIPGLNRESFEPTFPQSEYKTRMDRVGRVNGLESAWISGDNSLIYVRENAQAIRLPGGELLYWEGTVEDITEEKHAQQTLALYAQKLQIKQEVDRAILTARSPEEIARGVVTRIRELISCQRATVLLLDEDLSTARIAAAAAAPGWEGDLVEGQAMPIGQAIPEMLMESRQQYLVSDLDNLDIMPPSMIRLKQMGIRSLLVTPLISEDKLVGTLALGSQSRTGFDGEHQETASALGTQLAIAIHQAQLRSSLAEEKGRLRTLIEHLPAGVVLLDQDGRISEANQTALNHLQCLSPAKMGQVLRQIGDYDLGSMGSEADKDATLDLEVYSPSDGSTYEVVCRPIRQAKNSLGHTMILRDITAEKQLKRQIKIQERQASLGELATGVAHDFNNLISAIQGCAWIMAQQIVPSSPLAKPVGDISHICARATSLTQQLTAFAKTQAGQNTELDLNSLVQEMSSMLDRLLGGSIVMTSKLETDLPLLSAPTSRLEQIIVNLAVNARDAMPAGGELTISTATVRLECRDLAWHEPCEPGNYIKLMVSDTGRGMSPNTIERAFEPFYTTRSQQGGTGLGLATVRGIVAQLEGGVRIRSTVGQGTQVEILLPSEERASQTMDQERSRKTATP